MTFNLITNAHTQKKETFPYIVRLSQALILALQVLYRNGNLRDFSLIENVSYIICSKNFSKEKNACYYFSIKCKH